MQEQLLPSKFLLKNNRVSSSIVKASKLDIFKMQDGIATLSH